MRLQEARHQEDDRPELILYGRMMQNMESLTKKALNHELWRPTAVLTVAATRGVQAAVVVVDNCVQSVAPVTKMVLMVQQVLFLMQVFPAHQAVVEAGAMVEPTASAVEVQEGEVLLVPLGLEAAPLKDGALTVLVVARGWNVVTLTGFQAWMVGAPLTVLQDTVLRHTVYAGFSSLSRTAVL